MIRSGIFRRIAVELQSVSIEEKKKELSKVLGELMDSNNLPWKYFNLISTDLNVKTETLN